MNYRVTVIWRHLVVVDSLEPVWIGQILQTDLRIDHQNRNDARPACDWVKTVSGPRKNLRISLTRGPILDPFQVTWLYQFLQTTFDFWWWRLNFYALGDFFIFKIFLIFWEIFWNLFFINHSKIWNITLILIILFYRRDPRGGNFQCLTV